MFWASVSVPTVALSSIFLANIIPLAISLNPSYSNFLLVSNYDGNIFKSEEEARQFLKENYYKRDKSFLSGLIDQELRN